MITMDVKGITWVGNMYQKFENMFLEAEDVMYEVCLRCHLIEYLCFYVLPSFDTYCLHQKPLGLFSGAFLL